MKMRKFGKLGIDVSAFGVGCMRLPMIDKDGEKVVDEATSIKMIRSAIDCGVNYVDTAFGYLGGQSEVVVGKALSDGYRDKVNLATKLPCWMVNEPADMQKLLDIQLGRLQTDHLDFYLLHSLDAKRWETMKAFGAREFLTELKKKGIIKYACFSFHDDADTFKKIIDEYDWDMCQVQYNFMDINNQAGTAGVEYAGSKGIPVVIMEGLLGGKLANAPENVQALYDSYPVKRSPVEWAFRWLCDHKEVGTVLSGVSTMDQVRDNLRIFDTAEAGCMNDAEKELIAQVRDAYKSRILVDCTGCSYCMPCPMGVNIPRTFAIWNNASLYGGLANGNGEYQRMVKEGNNPASCVECGQCMTNCPQHINIPDMLKSARAALE